MAGEALATSATWEAQWIASTATRPNDTPFATRPARPPRSIHRSLVIAATFPLRPNRTPYYDQRVATTGAQLVTLDDVYAARERIDGRLHRTPLLGSATLSKQLDADVRFKAELFQRTGAFKPRGVLNKLATLTPEEKARGVISISAGNHAQALAYASAVEGIDALIVMWQTASPMKIAAARGYGATVDDTPADIPTAFEYLDQLVAETGRTLVHPYDDPFVMAGQGTVGLEILEDAPQTEVVLVPVGGGGLVSGIAAAIKGSNPAARVIAIEPELSNALNESLKVGAPALTASRSAPRSVSSRCWSRTTRSRTRSGSCTAA